MDNCRSRVRFYVVGGFLGSGKTTALTTLAGYFLQQGLQTAIITNDQTGGLVDSQVVRTHGIHYREISGACFCTRFRDFLDAADTLLQESHPQVILAEPVGSAADLIAAVLKPLRAYTQDRYEVMPLTVLADPELLLEMLSDNSPWPEDVRYLYEQQIREADYILLSKADNVPGDVMEAAKQKLRKYYETLRPNLRFQAFSAVGGVGIKEWLQDLENPSSAAEASLPSFDRDRHARAESALAWLNLEAALTAPDAETEIDLIALTQGFLQRLKDLTNGSRIAHLKVFAESSSQALKASVTDWRLGYSLDSLPCEERNLQPGQNEARILINMRALCDPHELMQIAAGALRDVSRL